MAPIGFQMSQQSAVVGRLLQQELGLKTAGCLAQLTELHLSQLSHTLATLWSDLGDVSAPLLLA